MREVKSSDVVDMGMYVRMCVLYILSAGLYVCMYARIAVVIMSVVDRALRDGPLVQRVDVILLTSVELGLGEVENGPNRDSAIALPVRGQVSHRRTLLLSFGRGFCPDGVVC